jgi:hypothetical protein
MAKLTDDEQTLTSLIDEAVSRLADLEKQRGNTDEMVNLIRGNRDWAKEIGERILNLSSTNRQRLVESMIDGKIGVSLESEENGVEHWGINPIFSFNIKILQTLSEEGGLGSLNPR